MQQEIVYEMYCQGKWPVFLMQSCKVIGRWEGAVATNNKDNDWEEKGEVTHVPL
jgi:hypothetical protein